MLINNEKAKITSHVKFVSYTGKYPNLCSGTLTLEIDGEQIEFGYDSAYPIFWSSGGSTDWHTDSIWTGDWRINVEEIPEPYRKYAVEIDYVFNANVEPGCCGGCI